MADRELEKLARYMLHIATIPDFTTLKHKVDFSTIQLDDSRSLFLSTELEACYKTSASIVIGIPSFQYLRTIEYCVARMHYFHLIAVPSERALNSSWTYGQEDSG